MSRAWPRLVLIGSCLAGTGAVHAWWNLRQLRSPEPTGAPVARTVDVLIPARDEAHRIGPTLASVLAQRDVPGLRVTVLDDASSDGTSDVVAAAAAGDPRLRLLRGTEEPPPGWLGKPYACQRLAEQADGDYLVFLDADVVLQPQAIAAAVAALEERAADLVSPWPRQDAVGAMARLLQPLQQWSWATTLPLRRAADSPRPSLAAANGQFLVLRRDAYRAIGGHRAVADCVLEDIELARAIKRAGGRSVLLDGHELAGCRMYDSDAEVLAGYRKSLWAAFGGRRATWPRRVVAAGAAWSVLATAYLAPPAALVLGPRRLRPVALAGTAAAIANRAMVADRTGARAWPDSLAHPVSIALFIGLSADSMVARAGGRATWKGRTVGVGDG